MWLAGRQRVRCAGFFSGDMRALLSALLVSVPLSSGAADDGLLDLSLEQLSKVRVSSISKRPETLAEAPAAIYVISREDIRRAGVVTVPEALRLAPNLQVARLDANQYAITARGFNASTANKLLVLIDGRSVYTSLYSGVFWDVQDVMLDDVERIEVISGPGATTWGSNAVNGVINIVTRRAELTQGTVAEGMYGNAQSGAQARIGGKLSDDTAYRFYAKYDKHDATKRSTGRSGTDELRKTQAGFRMDSGSSTKGATLLGDVYEGSIELPASRRLGHVSGANLIARWFRPTGEGGRQRVQLYYDGTKRYNPDVLEQRLDTVDLDALQSFRLGTKHLITTSAGYRMTKDRIVNGASLAFLPAEKTLRWGNFLINDDIQLSPATRMSLGSRFEYNVYTHWEVLPSLRLSHRLNERSVLWGSLSRSVRAPSRIDREVYSPATPPYAVAGGPDFVSEISNSAELGYRSQFSTALSYSINTFYHRFTKLRGASISGSSAVLDNSIRGHTYGVEAWSTYRVNPRWRIDTGFMRMRQNYVSSGVTNISSLGNDPKYQLFARTTIDLNDKADLGVYLRHVSRLPVPEVPAYTSLDLHTTYRFSRSLALSLAIENVLDDQHREFGTAATGSELGRVFRLGLSVAF